MVLAVWPPPSHLPGPPIGNDPDQWQTSAHNSRVCSGSRWRSLAWPRHRWSMFSFCCKAVSSKGCSSTLHRAECRPKRHHRWWSSCGLPPGPTAQPGFLLRDIIFQNLWAVFTMVRKQYLNVPIRNQHQEYDTGDLEVFLVFFTRDHHPYSIEEFLKKLEVFLFLIVEEKDIHWLS